MKVSFIKKKVLYFKEIITVQIKYCILKKSIILHKTSYLFERRYYIEQKILFL